MATANVPQEARQDRKNCTVVAFAGVLDRPYTEVRDDLLKANIYNPRRGSTYFQQIRWMKEQGKIVTDMNIWGYSRGVSSSLPTLAKFLRQADPTKTYLIYTNRHCQALVKGKQFNTYVTSRSRVRSAYIVEDKPTDKPMNKVVNFMAEAGKVGYTVAMLATVCTLTEKQVRGQIDRARKAGWKITCTKGQFRLVR